MRLRMKKLIIFLGIGLFSLNANALFLRYCTNSTLNNDDAVSYSYQFCINNNFRTIERAVENRIFLQYCSNLGQGVDSSFIGCINRNFKEVQRELNRSKPLFLNHCFNSSFNQLNYSFETCVRSNYRNIEREFNFPRLKESE